MPGVDFIKIRGARVHNLQNINLDIPKNKLVVITGVSGSGKSSLAFDTIYAEAERRFVESLSSYARQFLGIQDKPDVDSIDGLSPAISIDQKSVSKNPRSTVGTITEIYDYLRILFARIGKPHCPECGRPVGKQSIDRMVEEIKKLRTREITILAPLVSGKKGEHKGILEELERAGFLRVRWDGAVIAIREARSLPVDKKKKHSLEVVVDRVTLDRDFDRSRIADSLETALKIGKGRVTVQVGERGEVGETARNKAGRHNPTISPSGAIHQAQRSNDLIFSEHFACTACGISLPDIEPRLFSFNSPYGACPQCTGLGSTLEVDPELVIPNKNLSIAEGAIRPWASASHRLGRQSWYWWMLEDLSERLRFSLNTQVKNLSKKAIDTILYGEEAGDFEGVIPNLKRRWKETDSEWTRAEIERYMIIKPCPLCRGQRLRKEALAVTVSGKNIALVTALDVRAAKEFFSALSKGLAANEARIASPLVKEILKRLDFLVDVGLHYLTLDRESTTLAGGEAQRIQLATQIGSRLTGILYILDEPSVGLHARDHNRLIQTLKLLRDLGNTVIVVEHDRDTMRQSDWVIDLGPGAGKHGGRVVFEGTYRELLKVRTLTGDYLAGRKKVTVERPRVTKPVSSYGKRDPADETSIVTDKRRTNHLIIKGARQHNLKNIDVKVPLGKFVCISGVSGSGKSTLINDVLARALQVKFYRAHVFPGEHDAVLGTEHIDKVVVVDQSPIGRTPRSNPATYTGAFSGIREVFSKTPEARARGYQPGRFSFNVKGGRCEVCEGQGVKKIEMFFLPDVYVECEECKGKRYNQEALSIEYNGKNISQVLDLTIEEALDFFRNIPAVYQKLKTLHDVGLGYMKLGQPATTLSGGEAQRTKLSSELSRRDTGKTLYLLDEPTTGLHFDDIKKLLGILKALVARGNTVIVIEHNMEVLKNADHIIDLGPEGGEEGGLVVAEGTVRDIMTARQSYTGQWLKKTLAT